MRERYATFGGISIRVLQQKHAFLQDLDKLGEKKKRAAKACKVN
jgi:hypothetical protein